jgi:hypothetical protein
MLLIVSDFIFRRNAENRNHVVEIHGSALYSDIHKLEPGQLAVFTYFLTSFDAYLSGPITMSFWCLCLRVIAPGKCFDFPTNELLIQAYPYCKFYWQPLHRNSSPHVREAKKILTPQGSDYGQKEGEGGFVVKNLLDEIKTLERRIEVQKQKMENVANVATDAVRTREY